ncbi:MAG: GNAT family N-acetyltransferase [Caldilineaceae bacterium]|nr:GNAT family N-acetyltransferase [Caldilineaceae bacterium]MCB9151201.1 GNAT family N-acetyltransferase [Caldilineaceae bacterium]MCB9156213.1 GNAT family N-acetyltransferase [Caldilineaceae bacterium]
MESSNLPEQPLIIETEIPPSDLRFLEDQINQYNIQTTGFTDYRPLAAFVHNAQNDLIAGISGFTWGGCCEIQFLWVHVDYRHMGFGRQLLAAAEAEAFNRQCGIVVLNTHSFQAPAFYQKLGYTITGIDEDYPAGHRQYHLQKRL